MNHEDLEVWRMAVDLAAEIYQFTKTFPDDEKFGLVSQMRRAAVSIPSNIAEGAARQTRKEFLQFLHIAAGSVSELNTQMIIADKVGIGRGNDVSKIRDRLMTVTRMLQGLIRSIRAKEE